MKKIILAIIVIAVVVGGLYYTRQEGVYTVDSSDYLAPGVFVSSTTEVLNEEEEAGLLLMREEEKLARDVYTALADMWGARVFSHIARSEQTHMDAVLDLLNAYNVPDPVAVDEPGKFVNPELQALYESLVDRGSSSIAEAYQVGATIEDLDIADLDRLLAQTNNADIAVTYKNLQKGSRNHLRAFVKNIRDEYIPQYISEEQYQLIISSPQEREWFASSMARAFAFDFDGVIATYSGFKGSDSVEAPNDEVIRAIRTLKERGHTIIVHSTRGEAVLRAYCATHNIPVDYFNENPNEHGENYGKPIAHAYVDDRAVNYHMQTAEELVEQLESFQPHWK